jgi:hypothetical protein
MKEESEIRLEKTRQAKELFLDVDVRFICKQIKIKPTITMQ